MLLIFSLFMRRPNLTFGQNGDEVKPLTTNEIKPLSEDERRTLSRVDIRGNLSTKNKETVKLTKNGYKFCTSCLVKIDLFL